MSWVDVFYPPTVWVDITPPLSWADTWGSQDEWARASAHIVLALRGEHHGWLTLRRLARSLERVYDVYSARQLGDLSYLYLGNLRDLTFRVSVSHFPAEGDREVTLRRLVRADDPELMRPPHVEVFEAAHLGVGLKALGHVVLDDDSIAANLWYAFRDETHQVDVVVLASTEDLVRLARITPDIEALVHGITVRADDEPGWWAGIAEEAGIADEAGIGPAGIEPPRDRG